MLSGSLSGATARRRVQGMVTPLPAGLSEGQSAVVINQRFLKKLEDSEIMSYS